MVRGPAVLVVAALLVAACSAGDDVVPAEPTASAPVVAGADRAADSIVRIGDRRFELTATCAAGGAGEVEVALSGTAPDGTDVIGYLRAFVGSPYVAVQVGDGAAAQLYEPRLDDALNFDLTTNGVLFPDISFVTDLDLDTGQGTPAGSGSIVVFCDGYERSLPPVPFE